jgi:ubiquitin-like protein Nedd8
MNTAKPQDVFEPAGVIAATYGGSSDSTWNPLVGKVYKNPAHLSVGEPLKPERNQVVGKTGKDPAKTSSVKVIWQIFVRPLRGATIVIQVGPSERTDKIKEAIQAKVGTPTEFQRLIHAGRFLVEGRTAAEIGLGDGANINLTVRTIGGPAAVEVVPAAGEVERPGGDDGGRQRLKIATLNVGKNLMGKMESIIRELDEQGIHVALLQEVNGASAG